MRLLNNLLDNSLSSRPTAVHQISFLPAAHPSPSSTHRPVVAAAEAIHSHSASASTFPAVKHVPAAERNDVAVADAVMGRMTVGNDAVADFDSVGKAVEILVEILDNSRMAFQFSIRSLPPVTAREQQIRRWRCWWRWLEPVLVVVRTRRNLAGATCEIDTSSGFVELRILRRTVLLAYREMTYCSQTTSAIHSFLQRN